MGEMIHVSETDLLLKVMLFLPKLYSTHRLNACLSPRRNTTFAKQQIDGFSTTPRGPFSADAQTFPSLQTFPRLEHLCCILYMYPQISQSANYDETFLISTFTKTLDRKRFCFSYHNNCSSTDDENRTDSNVCMDGDQEKL